MAVWKKASSGATHSIRGPLRNRWDTILLIDKPPPLGLIEPMKAGKVRGRGVPCLWRNLLGVVVAGMHFLASGQGSPVIIASHPTNAWTQIGGSIMLGVQRWALRR